MRKLVSALMITAMLGGLASPALAASYTRSQTIRIGDSVVIEIQMLTGSDGQQAVVTVNGEPVNFAGLDWNSIDFDEVNWLELISNYYTGDDIDAAWPSDFPMSAFPSDSDEGTSGNFDGFSPVYGDDGIDGIPDDFNIFLPGYDTESKTGFDNFTRTRSYTGQFQDLPSDAWYYQNVSTLYEMDLMSGQSENSFNPNGYTSISEALAVACRLLRIYNGDTTAFETSSPWYQTYVTYGINNGIITDGQFSDYSAVASRADLARIFGGLRNQMLAPINTIEEAAIPDVPTWNAARDAVYRLYRAGIVSGSDSQGSFQPYNAITRAEVAAITSRIADPSLRVHQTLNPVVTTVYSDNGPRQIPVADVPQYQIWGWKSEPVPVTAKAGTAALMNAAILLPMKTNHPELDAIIDDIFAQIFTDGMTTYQKVKACYDYLINNTSYQAAGSLLENRYQSPKDEHMVCLALSLFKEHVGVCTSYAAAFQAMTRRIGLESYVYNGQHISQKGGLGGHSWNVIKLGGVEYYFDAEVEDVIAKGKSIPYQRFFKTYDQMKKHYFEPSQQEFNEYKLR